MEEIRTKLRRYFLENLSLQEVEKIEMRILTEPDFAAELDAAETELMEDYLEQTLSAEERDLFETNFLITEERRKHLEFLRSLKRFAKNAALQSSYQEKPKSLFESLKMFFSPQRTVIVGGLIVLVLVIGIVWQGILPTNNLNPEVANLNQKDLSNIEEFKNLTNLSLVSGNLRSDDSLKNLNSQDLTEKVFIRLGLPANTSLDLTFQVNILQHRKLISSLSKVKIYGNQAAQELRILLPATLLKNGEYQIEVQKENSTESKIIYNFTVR